MEQKLSYNKRTSKAKRLLRSISDFAAECLNSADMNTLYSFSGELCNILENAGDTYEQANYARRFSF